jgi:hypothetical protein
MQPSPGPDLRTLHLDSSSIIMNNAPVQILVPVNLLPADNLESSPTAPGPGLVPSDPAPTEGMPASAAMPIIGGHHLVSSAGHDSIAAPALCGSPLVGPLQTLLRPVQGRHRLLSPRLQLLMGPLLLVLRLTRQGRRFLVFLVPSAQLILLH